MTSLTENIETESSNGAINDENLPLDSNQISSDEQLTQAVDSTDPLPTGDDTNIDESESKSSSTTTTRTAGQTAIGAKLVKKLETLGIFTVIFFFLTNFSL